MTDETPEPDRVDGAPHPRETVHLYGHAGAEAAFLDAFNAGRVHHGWLLTGPRGVGKATLAWRIARFLLATPDGDGGLFAPPPPTTLAIPADHPVARRMVALSEGRLFLLRRGWDEDKKRLKTVITVDEVRRMQGFLRLSAADGGRRVVIVDPADELNPQAANALLKLLEEPPAGVTLLLVSHQPAGLLPTIRSRCRTLPLSPLSAQDLAAALAQAGGEPVDPVALAELAGGSVGEALRVSEAEGLALYADLVALLSTRPVNRPRLLALTEAAARGGEARFDLTLRLLDLLLARAARTGATGATPPPAAPGEAALLTRLAPDLAAAQNWAELAQTLGARVRAGRAVNLDGGALLLDMVLKIDAAAAAPPRQPGPQIR